MVIKIIHTTKHSNREVVTLKMLISSHIYYRRVLKHEQAKRFQVSLRQIHVITLLA